MNIEVAHHIYGSDKGYQTLFKSSNITQEELIELENFSFGQTNDLTYMESLDNHPAYMVRKLSSNRWAITRVFEGANDEYRRATLLFHTLLLDRNTWIDTLRCDVQPLLFHDTIWDNKEKNNIFLKLASSPIPQDIKRETASLLQIIRNTDRRIVVNEALCPFQIIRWLNLLMTKSERESFTYGYRVLSDTLGLSLLCLSAIVTRRKPSAECVYLESFDFDDITPALPHQLKEEMPHDVNIDSNAFDVETKSNVLRVVLIGFVLMIGAIATVIMSMVIYINFQYRKDVKDIESNAYSFLDNDKKLFELQSERKQKISEGRGIIDRIEKHNAKKTNTTLSKLQIELKRGIENIILKGKKYDSFNSTIKQLKSIIGEVTTQYPTRHDIEKVQSIQLALIDDEIEEIRSNEAVALKIDDSLIAIKQWKYDIFDILQKIDLSCNQEYEAYSFIDPNQPTNIDDSIIKGDPNQFVNEGIADFIKSRQTTLSRSSRNMQSRKSNISIRNASLSPYEEHKKYAQDLSRKIEKWNRNTNKYNQNLRDFQEACRKLHGIEDILNNKKGRFFQKIVLVQRELDKSTFC